MEEFNIKTRVVGVDISNERTTYAIVDIRGNILAENSFSTENYPDINQFVTVLSERIVMQVEENGGYETIRSIGVSSPSASPVSGCIENAANLPWKGVIPLAAMLRDRLGLAVGLSNDAHISALGEYTFGNAHGMSNFVLVSLGVGVGSCFFSSGRDHQGHLGFAGEFGHTCIVDHGRKCACGHEGCLESYVGAAGIVNTAQEVLAENSGPSMLRELEKLSPRTICDCCNKGDEMAIEIYHTSARYLGKGLSIVIDILNPELIVIGSVYARNEKLFYDEMMKVIREEALAGAVAVCKVVPAALGEAIGDYASLSIAANLLEMQQ